MLTVKICWSYGKMPARSKHKVFAQEKRKKKIYLVVTILVIVLIVAAVSYVLVTNPLTPSSSENNGALPSTNVLNAALIDALYSTLPNDEFTDSLKKTLETAGFEVDVFQGTDVTVDFLKNLTSGYDLIVLRMHSALHYDDLYLFTGEPYSVNKYTDEQYFRLVKEAFATDTSDAVFAVNWGFVKRCMAEKFNDTLIVMMGCDGTSDSTLIDEFMNQDAVGYISWDGPVSINHSDSATLQLVKYLYLDDLSVRDAIQNTNLQIGADPEWGSYLEYYTP
jgi:hypothetical protein